MTENEIYSRPMQLVSNTILSVYSSSKLRAGITRDGAIISMDPIIIAALEPPH